MTHAQIKASLKKLIQAQKELSFQKSDEVTDEEALGVMISQYFEWVGWYILKAAQAGLHDANFHSAANDLDPLVERYK